MAQLRHTIDTFTQNDTEVVVVGPEKASTFEDYFTKNDLPFIGLPDPKHSVLRLYGQEIKLFKLGRMPAQILIDKSGTVRLGHYGHDMTNIPTPQEMLELIENL